MIYATDISYSEVRTQYVVPLLNELLQKSGLSGIVTNIERISSDPSLPTSAVTGTLFDDITATIRGEGASKKTTATLNGVYANSRCYHEVSFSLHIHLWSSIFGMCCPSFCD